jgi:formate dehydrogenase major subunit
MNAPLDALVAEDAVVFRLNGEDVAAAPGETILQAADRVGVAIPRLCYKDGYRPDGNCRACVVEIKGERVLAPSCCRKPVAGMEVSSTSARALHSQKLVVELLASDMPERSYKTQSELDYWKRELAIGTPRFARRAQPAADISHPAMAVNLDACIQCTRCVRACREEQVNDVIGYAFRGAHSKNACRRARPARSRPRTTRSCSGSTARSTPCAPTAASAARSRTTSRTTGSCTWKAATARRTTRDCA